MACAQIPAAEQRRSAQRRAKRKLFGGRKNILPFCTQRGAPRDQQTSQEKHGRNSTRSEQTRSARGAGEKEEPRLPTSKKTRQGTCSVGRRTRRSHLSSRGAAREISRHRKASARGRGTLKAGSGQDQACLQGRLRRRGDTSAAALLALWIGVKSADGEKRTTAETLEREEKKAGTFLRARGSNRGHGHTTAGSARPSAPRRGNPPVTHGEQSHGQLTSLGSGGCGYPTIPGQEEAPRAALPCSDSLQHRLRAGAGNLPSGQNGFAPRGTFSGA